MNKKDFTIIYPIVAVLIIAASALCYANYKKPVEENLGATTLKVPNGGTGATTFTAGECLVGNGTGAISSQACGGTADLATAQLGQIGDVSTSTLAYGHVLIHDGTNWQDTATGSLGIIGMVYPGAGIALSTGAGWDSSITDNSANWNTAYSWGNHAGLYDPLGQATSTLASHTSTYNHANYNTAYTNASTSPYSLFQIKGDYITLTSLTGDSPITYNNSTGHIGFDGSTYLTQALATSTYTTQASSTATYLSISSWNASTTKTNLRVGTADALTSNPSDCSANQFANAIAANGNLTCSALTDADIPDDITASNYVRKSTWTDLDSYPSACGAGQYVTQVGDTLTCSAPSSLGYLTAVGSDSTWTQHNSYPSGCTAGQFVTAIGDTLTCDTPAGSSLDIKNIATGTILYLDTNGELSTSEMFKFFADQEGYEKFQFSSYEGNYVDFYFNNGSRFRIASESVSTTSEDVAYGSYYGLEKSGFYYQDGERYGKSGSLYFATGDIGVSSATDYSWISTGAVGVYSGDLWDEEGLLVYGSGLEIGSSGPLGAGDATLYSGDIQNNNGEANGGYLSIYGGAVSDAFYGGSIDLYAGSGDYGGDISIVGGSSNLSNNEGGNVWIQSGYDDSSNYSFILLNDKGGNVGIGTSNPTTILEVTGTSTFANLSFSGLLNQVSTTIVALFQKLNLLYL